MSPPEKPDDSRQRKIGFKIFRGRRLGPLVGPWLSSALIAAIVYYAERTMPALHDVAGLIYWSLVVIVIIATGRWLRVRSSDRRERDRREGDRHQSRPRSE